MKTEKIIQYLISIGFEKHIYTFKKNWYSKRIYKTIYRIRFSDGYLNINYENDKFIIMPYVGYYIYIESKKQMKNILKTYGVV